MLANALEFFAGMFVSSLLQDFIDKIKTSSYDQICHAYSDVEKKLKALERRRTMAESMIDKVDGWELVTSKAHRDWVGDAMRACYDIEDEWLGVMLEIENKGNPLSCLKSWALSREIDKLQHNLDDILGKASEFVTLGSRKTVKITQPTHTVAVDQHVILPVIYESFQRKREQEEIIEMLLCSTNNSSTSNHSGNGSSIILSIEGMFGLGKTKLAQQIKNDHRILRHFGRKIWVSVAGDFNLGNVISSVIQARHWDEIRGQQFTSMSQSLCNGRRVLIVLDDLCNFVRPQDWEDFQSLLVNPTNTNLFSNFYTPIMFGVLITTSNPKVTKIVTSLSTIPVVPFHLQLMSDEDCRSLIVSRAPSATADHTFKRKHWTRNREETALKIAEKFCKGLPLVADIIGVHLSSEPEDRWINMLSKDLWNMPEFKEKIFPSFSSHYSDLPKALKNCFRYLSLFPNNFKFKKEDLVQLWMAQGFCNQDCRETFDPSSLEEIGNDYFDELFSRSILQIYNPFDHEPQVYRVHDFIHHYAQYVSSNLHLRLDKQFVDAYSSVNRNSLQLARHMSFLSRSIAQSILKDMEKCKGLRTLVSLHEQTQVGPLTYKFFLTLQSLRVLSLSGTDINKLPESIGKLKHLQLLDVSSTYIEYLPASTPQLKRLQVLKLKDCPELLQLPKDTKNLTNLLHLEVDESALSSMPPEIGKLVNLRTLPVFIVGNEEGQMIKELKNMKHLQGSICLKDLENVTTYEDTREAMLSTKSSLKKLELEWGRSSYDHLAATEVLDGLEPHENLEELHVTGYYGIQFPSWLSSPKCTIENLHLQRCHGCSILPPLGQLQHLRDLHIQEMHSVKYVDHRFSRGPVPCFPSLLSLKFQDMMNLEKWEGLQATHMPRLRDLKIIGCPNLIALPSLNQLSSLEKLEIRNCPLLQSLPEEGLPKSLESFIIVGCDLVKNRCHPEEGADWVKIKFVPEVVIDFVQIRTLTTRSRHDRRSLIRSHILYMY